MKLLSEDKGKRTYVDSTNHHFYEVPMQVRAQTVTFETKRDFRIDPVILSGMHDQAERMLGEWFSKRGGGGKMGATSEGELSFRTTRVRHWELDEDGNETGKLLYFVKVTAEQAFWPPEPVDPTGEEPPLPRPSDFIGDHLKVDANEKTTDTEE